MLLKNQWVNNEIKEEIKKYLETNENENNHTKSMGCSKSSSWKFRYRPSSKNKKNLK